jgi:hypothetical protein
MDVHQVSHAMGEVGVGSMVGHVHVPPATVAVEVEEEIGSAIPLVLIVESSRLAGFRGQWLPDFTKELKRMLVETDHGTFGVRWFGVEVQDVFHLSHEPRVDFQADTTFSSATA